MAAPCSLAAPILLLVVLCAAPAVHSVHAPARAAAGNVQKFCAKTDNAEACAKVLSAYPESKTASVRRLAELVVLSASKKATEENALIQAKVKAMKQPPQYCIENCVEEVNGAATKLAELTAAEMTDAKFTDAKWFLKGGILSTPTNCGQCASSVPLTPEETAVTEQGYRLWNDLVTAANVVLTVSPLP